MRDTGSATKASEIISLFFSFAAFVVAYQTFARIHAYEQVGADRQAHYRHCRTLLGLIVLGAGGVILAAIKRDWLALGICAIGLLVNIA